MSNSSLPPAPTVGRLTGLVLGLVVFICVIMIGLAGYLKFELDRAETLLAAPESTLASSGQDMFARLKRDLGYGGFVGSAQTFVISHDAGLLSDMKAELKEARDILTHLPEKTPGEARHDLQAILGTFDAALDRAEKSTADPANSFTAADLTPLYSALPVLDYRVSSAAATNRLIAQDQAQFWAMLLTLVSWCSLIIAAALAVGIYLSLRDRNSAPLRGLAQSVKNMARGDMRTPIWGMERHDMVGELARAVDMARYQFSQLPDMTLLSEEGPVRLRFEGNTRSMFEAMMRIISRDSEQVHQQATNLNETIAKQQDTLGLIVSRVEAVLQNVEKRAVNGDQQVRQALLNMLSSAESLKNSQEHAADQLSRVVPYLQERARGLSEITQLTGKQVAQVLQSLILTERGLRASAIEGEGAIKKLSLTADNLGERLFGAVNLLQASGKVLAETTEKTQSRLDQAILNLNRGSFSGTTGEPAAALDSELMPRMENIASIFEATQAQLENVLAEQTQATKAQVDLLTTHSSSVATQAATVAQALAAATDRMREQQTKFDGAIGQFATRLNDFGDRIERLDVSPTDGIDPTDMQQKLGDLSSQVALIADKIVILTERPDPQAREPAFVSTLLLEIKTGFEVVGLQLERTRDGFAASKVASPEIADQVRDQWYQMAAQIEATRTGLAQIITDQVSRIDTKLAAWPPQGAPVTDSYQDAQQQFEQQTNILSELVTTLGVLDAHMQEIRSQVSNIRQAG